MGNISTDYSGGSSSASLVTPQQPNESVDDWIERHFLTVGGSSASDSTQFVTSWKCDGITETETTDRLPGEGYTTFFRRHKIAAKASMDSCPPE